MMKRIRVMRLLYFDAMKVQIYYDIPAKETPMLTYNLSILQRKRGICLGQCNGDYWLVASVLLVTVQLYWSSGTFFRRNPNKTVSSAMTNQSADV